MTIKMAAVTNKLVNFVTTFSFVFAFILSCHAVRYEPNWASIDSRRLPAWYDQSKIGIFIHWGVFSVPSIESEWFWADWIGGKTNVTVNYMKKNYKPDFTYPDFAKDFTADLFNPDEWADIFEASGAKYIVLTSKHHEGFTNWPSKYSFNWNSMDVGPNKDLVGSLATAIRKKKDMRFGLYHSLFEWYHPLFMQDKSNKWTTTDFVKVKTMPELYEIVKMYQPEVIWSDGDWDAPDTYWNSTEFIAWLYNDSPVKDTVVTNDRWGSGIMCHHGGFLTCSDRYNPGKLQSRKWENAMTIDKKSWGYRRTADLADILTMEELIGTVASTFNKWENAMTIDKKSWGYRRTADLADILTMEELIGNVASTVSCGGNILINVGPTSSGTIVPIFEERLRSLGKWLGVNGEAIYNTTYWKKCQNDTLTPNVWYTAKNMPSGKQNVYAIVLDWPSSDKLDLACPTPTGQVKVTLLGYDQPIKWESGPSAKGISLDVPVIPFNKMPCSYAWVFKMENLFE